jgi:hypothetical protein
MTNDNDMDGRISQTEEVHAKSKKEHRTKGWASRTLPVIHPRLDILRSLDEGTTDSVVNSLSCRVHVGGRSEAGWTRPTRRGRSIPIENAKIDRVVDRGWTSVVLVVGERPVVKSEAKRSVGLYCRVIVEKLSSAVRALAPAWFVVTL